MIKKDQTSSQHIRNLRNEQKKSKFITDKNRFQKEKEILHLIFGSQE
ncbi:hypothetical protein LEP1GSC100_3253 [Leptospira interrogans serovar Bataviae str. UI 08561]|nr:hypothetical protein LEP1GSC100_3253 [Leptospira interrogans serovar Bataviae str. UI 08561]